MEKTFKYHVKGMHCASCVVLTEMEVMEFPFVKYAKSNLAKNEIEITGDFGAKNINEIAHIINPSLEKKGYRILVEKDTSVNEHSKWLDFKWAIPIAVLFLVIFFLLQKSGLVSSTGGENMSYGAIFLIGVIASISTCMAIVGGLLLSISANYAKSSNDKKPQLLFHIGRLVSFFVLGGVIGKLGSAFTLNPTLGLVLNIIIGLVMVILGLNLLNVFHFTKKLQPTSSKSLASKILSLSKINHTLTPLLIGIGTFFLPCGFTQSMQIYTLSTKSFLSGGLTMLVFALGTLPVLAAISFTTFRISQNRKSGIFFKTAGLIVIAFAIINLINALVVSGIIRPIFNF